MCSNQPADFGTLSGTTERHDPTLSSRRKWDFPPHVAVFDIFSLAAYLGKYRARQEWERDGKPTHGPLFSKEHTNDSLRSLVSCPQAMADIFAFARADEVARPTMGAAATPLEALEDLLDSAFCGVAGSLRRGLGQALRPARQSGALAQEAITEIGAHLLLRLDKIETFISAKVMILRNFPEEQKSFPLDEAERATVALYQYMEAMRAEIAEFMEPVPANEITTAPASKIP